MVKKITKYAKFVMCCALIVSLIAPSYAALSASDGSAFVTKAEFDAALADFNSRLTTFEAGINSKIDSQVTSYLDRNGIWNGKDQELLSRYNFYRLTGSDTEWWKGDYNKITGSGFLPTWSATPSGKGTGTLKGKTDYMGWCEANKSGLVYISYTYAWAANGGCKYTNWLGDSGEAAAVFLRRVATVNECRLKDCAHVYYNSYDGISIASAEALGGGSNYAGISCRMALDWGVGLGGSGSTSIDTRASYTLFDECVDPMCAAYVYNGYEHLGKCVSSSPGATVTTMYFVSKGEEIGVALNLSVGGRTSRGVTAVGYGAMTGQFANNEGFLGFLLDINECKIY